MKKIREFIRKCPFFLLLVSTGVVLSLLGLGGKNNVYAGQEYNPLTEPAASVVFTALNDGIYPWQIFSEESRSVMAEAESTKEESGETTPAAGVAEENSEGSAEESMAAGEEGAEGATGRDDGDGEDSSMPAEGEDGGEGMEEESGAAGTGTQAGEADSTEEDSPASEENEAAPDTQEDTEDDENASSSESDIPKGRLEPLRASTHEEYINHISADIYGDAGVKRAAEYGFVRVDESYFDDALFIGDSRTVGLRDYTDLSDHADFYSETSLTIYKVLEESFKGKGTVTSALERKDYGKIYIMVGINELGTGTTEDFMKKYTEVIDTLHELEPEAKIFIQGIMRVTGKKHNSDPIYNNNNINARNNAIATLADNEQIFYIDVNEVVCDEEGNLNAEYTFDQLHLLGAYDELWKEFLLNHGVIE